MHGGHNDGDDNDDTKNDDNNRRIRKSLLSLPEQSKALSLKVTFGKQARIFSPAGIYAEHPRRYTMRY
jgi:hypothetical protein